MQLLLLDDPASKPPTVVSADLAEPTNSTQAEQMSLQFDDPVDDEVKDQLQSYMRERKKRRVRRVSGFDMLREFLASQLSLFDEDPTLATVKFDITMGGVLTLLEGVLEHNLRQLMSKKTSRDLREQMFEWVATPLKMPTAAANTDPFSFQACCNAAGYRADYLQCRLFMILGLARWYEAPTWSELNAVEDAAEAMLYGFNSR